MPSSRIASSVTLHYVREGFFREAEIHHTGEEEDQGRQARDDQHRTGTGCRAEQRPPETLHDTDHRVEPVEGAPGLRDQAARISDGGGEHPDLCQKWDRVS